MTKRLRAWRYELLMMGVFVLALGVESRLDLTPTGHHVLLAAIVIGFYGLLMKTAGAVHSSALTYEPPPVAYRVRTVRMKARRFRTAQGRSICLRMYDLPKRKALH